jgi:hypothetical protein
MIDFLPIVLISLFPRLQIPAFLLPGAALAKQKQSSTQTRSSDCFGVLSSLFDEQLQFPEGVVGVLAIMN